MSIQQNSFIQESSKLIQEDPIDSNQFFSWFQNKFETIKAFVEDLRQLQIQITAKEDSDISKYTQAIANYLQHPNALMNQKLYRNSLISLGNFLSIKYSFLKKEFLTQKFFKNLIQYFSILCEKQSEQDFNMLIYPAFYLIVLIIYNADKQTANILHSQLFVKKFLKALCSVEFKQGNKIERYLPVMIAFIAKGSQTSESSALLKSIVLNNLHFSEIQKNQFHFIYSLRVLINKESFSLAQVRKFELIEYLAKYLEKNQTSEQSVSMILEIIKHIIKRHRILSYKLISSNFLNIMESAYKVNPDNVLSLLEVIAPCLPYNYKQRMLQIQMGLLKKYQHQNMNSIDLKQLQSLKIISIIVEQMSFNEVLVLLQNYSIESLLERTFRGDKKFTSSEENDVIGMLTKIVKLVSVENENMKNSILLVISQYRRFDQRIKTLVDSYMSDVQVGLF